MGDPKGGKTKAEGRIVAVKLSPEARARLAELCFRRITAGRPYDETTQAGVVMDALALLHGKEVGGTGEGLTVPEEPKVPSVPELTESAEQLKTEYDTFTTAEGVSNLPWDQFLTIRKLRIQKGAWKYGPNQL